MTPLIAGAWNGLWTNQCKEFTFLKYSHRGVIGITLKQEVLKTLALSCHIYCKIESDTKKMEEEDRDTSTVHLIRKRKLNHGF